MTPPTAKSDLSATKRVQILHGACALFRELGYERASVDAIASRAGVSKATIYNHFHDKEALFLATVETENEQSRARFLALLETPSGDIAADLRHIGAELINLISSPISVHRYRIITAEVGRFPALSQSLYECGVVVGQRKMATYFERAAAMGLLDVDDPADAALDFTALCAYHISMQLHLGVVREATPEFVSTHLERAIATFLRAYRLQGEAISKLA